MTRTEPLVAGPADVYSSGVSWGAVIGGAFVAAALGLILLALGAGFGLSATSPWPGSGASVTELGVGAIFWLIVMQAVSSGMGGWLTGRLRTRWVSVHTDEVHFRDTANGFLAWAVAVVVTFAFLATAGATMAGRAAEGAAMAGGHDRNGYFVDRLFRSVGPSTQPMDPSTLDEADAAFGAALAGDRASPADLTYLTQLVAARTGLSPGEAQRRVSDTLTEARQAADTARRNAARLLLWTFIALLVGAFCASYAATIGGRQRDHVPAV